MNSLKMFVRMYLSLLVIICMPVLIVTGVYHFYLILQNNPTGINFILGFFLVLGTFSGFISLASGLEQNE